MHVFKHLTDSLRLRCSKYRDENAKCTAKINIPLPTSSGWRIISDPLQSIPGNLPSFNFQRFKYSKQTVSLALYFSIVICLPARVVAQILSDVFQLLVSHDSITRWTKKASLALHDNLSKIQLPSSQVWHVDEAILFSRGQKVWLWLVKDSFFRLTHSWYFSARRATQHARNAFSIAPHLTIMLPQRLVSDGLWSYSSAKKDLSPLRNTEHWVCKDLSASVNNNLVERQFGAFKDLARLFRGFKTQLGLWAFITSHVYYHNFFKPQASVGN